MAAANKSGAIGVLSSYFAGNSGGLSGGVPPTSGPGISGTIIWINGGSFWSDPMSESTASQNPGSPSPTTVCGDGMGGSLDDVDAFPVIILTMTIPLRGDIDMDDPDKREILGATV